MKKFLSICVLAAGITGYAQAQTTAGNMLVGGGIGYTSQKDESPGDDASNNTFSFTPSFGYFVADNFAVGLNLNFSTSKRENWDDIADEYTYSEFLFEPFARYYMFTPNDKFAFFAEGAFGLGSTKYDADGGGELKGSLFRFRVSPGFAYFLSDKWSLDFQLSGISYTSVNPNKDSDAEDDKQSEFVFGVDSFNPTLGFRYVIGN